MNDEDSKKIFKAEARDLLETIERGLLDLEQKPTDADLIAKIFRAMHTLKGSGAMFGFDTLADFAHRCETAFDRVRKNEARATPELICAVLAAIDHLRMLAEGAPDSPETIQSLIDILEATVENSRTDRSPTPAQEETWHLKFRFSPDALKNGTRPLGLLDELRTLGHAVILADTSAIPPIDQLDPTQCHIGWDVKLKTSQPRSQIEEIFEFDRPNMMLSIEAMEKPHGTTAVKPAMPTPPTQAPPEEVEDTVRIPAARLDALMDCVGELVIAQSRLKQTALEIENVTLDVVSEDIERLSNELRESMMSARMVPLSNLFARFRRLVHDLARDTAKKIEFLTAGEATELDKTVLERLSDPLIHIIRNAADHGLESPEERLAAGKPETGFIRLSTRQAGAVVEIRLEDDGRGLDRARIRAKAEETGLIAPGTDIGEDDLLQIVFRPGFSTARAVTGLSGRGVGMDAVKTAIEALRGSVALSSQTGAGTTVILRIPLTLAIIDGLMIRVGSERYIIPLAAVEECAELPPSVDNRPDGRRMMPLRGEFVPYLRLKDLFETESTHEECRYPDESPKIVIVATANGRFGMTVDEIVGDYQTVIKPLSNLHARLGLFSGATILGDGNAALILDVSRIAEIGKHAIADLALAENDHAPH